MDKKQKLQSLYESFQGIFGNIELNAEALIGMAVIYQMPNSLNSNSPKFPQKMMMEGSVFDVRQCLGLSLTQDQKDYRIGEIFALARRSLLCEALENSADILARVASVLERNIDPYEQNEYASINIRDLWSSKSGKSGSLIKRTDREFFEKCAAPLRNIIRHNNGRLPPNKEIVYSGSHRGKHINIRFEQEQPVQIPMVHIEDIFFTIQKIVDDGIQYAIDECKNRG